MVKRLIPGDSRSARNSTDRLYSSSLLQISGTRWHARNDSLSGYSISAKRCWNSLTFHILEGALQYLKIPPRPRFRVRGQMTTAPFESPKIIESLFSVDIPAARFDYQHMSITPPRLHLQFDAYYAGKREGVAPTRVVRQNSSATRVFSACPDLCKEI